MVGDAYLTPYHYVAQYMREIMNGCHIRRSSLSRGVYTSNYSNSFPATVHV